VQNYATVPDAPDLTPLNALTLSTWLKTAPSATGIILDKWKTDGSSGSYSLSMTNGHIALDLSLEGTVFSLTTATALADSDWHHVAGTYDGAQMVLFLDGAASTSGAAGGRIDTVDAPLVIGGLPATIDDLRIYDSALTADRISALYAAATAHLIPESDHTSTRTGPSETGTAPSLPITVPQPPLPPETPFTKDTVGDSIPDWWRARYFGGDGTATDSTSCATCDPDGDHINNLQEYQYGTDPRRADPLNVQINGGNNKSITVNAPSISPARFPAANVSSSMVKIWICMLGKG